MGTCFFTLDTCLFALFYVLAYGEKHLSEHYIRFFAFVFLLLGQSKV